MPQCNDDFLKNWENLVDEVNKTEVPMICVKKIQIKFHNNRQKTISLAQLRRQGLDWEEIETLVSRTLESMNDQIRSVDFVVDINTVAEIVQPQTNHLLKNL